MRVLLLGATGNLGLRLVPALLSHGHTVVAYVRNPPKLRSLLAPELISSITIEEGDATDSDSITRVLLRQKCNALVCAAGMVVMNPWGKANLPEIAEATALAAISASKEGKEPLRAWFLAGMSLLDYPQSTYFLADYIPVGREHISTMKMLQSKPSHMLSWSILCPSGMSPAIATADLRLLQAPRKHSLILKADTAPGWTDHWFTKVPLVGRYINTMSGYMNHVTSLEDCADFIADDLASGSTEWIHRKVGVKEKSSK